MAPTAHRLILFAALLSAGQSPAATGEHVCALFDPTHARWGAVLSGHVKAGVVDYAGLRAAPAALTEYLQGLESVCADGFATWTRERKVAFWINAYNAWTVKVVLDHYPLESIRQIGLLPGAAWRDRVIPLGHLAGGGGKISLNTIEHEILRKDFRDARHHFALVCAARSCPELRSEAYRADRLSEQLDDAGRRFLADETKNRFDPAKGVWHLSSIFKWYREDFERDGKGLVPFLSRFAGAKTRAAVAAGQPRLEFLDYDWSLNGR